MITNNDNLAYTLITADEGKLLRRISDGFIYGKEVALGYTHYLHGELLEEPLLELPEHFEEIDEPVIEAKEEFIDFEEIVE